MKRTLLAAIVLSAVIVAAGGLWFHHSLWGTRSSRPVELEIAAGSTASEILTQLRANDLLPSVVAGRIYLRALAPGQSLYYGHYQFPSASRPVDVLETILEGAVEMFTVTLVEGSDVAKIGEQFAGLGLGTAEEWQGFGQRVEWISDLAANAPSLEGFFFPDTYRFAIGIPAERAARHLVERFEEVWSEEAQRTDALWGSTLEIVTLASLVEAETSLDGERPLIAGVFANRLRRSMLLQCDPTVVYALKRRNEWQGRLLRIHWEVDDPYNTYRYPGLPPGPINSPGRAALAAAINPQPSPYLYFVAKPGGGHAFSKTLAEHNRAVARLMGSRR
ncbi:MAG: endolytic transglycosylase MltG [Thermoanaerobaculales bacterium]|nr:endolytic transglycosylase MltG [Thermoanaerobaculales bacterium]